MHPTVRNVVVLGEAAFTPLSLFANGEDGFLYDFSKTDRTFQESAGETAADDDAEVVGLALEQSQWGGRTLAEVIAAQSEIIANGSFSVDANWSKGTGWTIEGGLGVGASTSLALIQGPVLTAGNWYRRVFDLVSRSTGSARVDFTGDGGPAKLVAGTYPSFGLATGTSALVQGVSSFSGTVDNVSIKHIPGNHSRQATGGARPQRKTGGFLRFDGSDDNLLTTLNPSAAFTMVAKFNVATASRVMLGTRASGTTHCFLGLSSGGLLAGGVGAQVTSTINGGGDVRNTTGVGALSYDGTTVKLFWNGAQVYSAAQSGLATTTVPLRIMSLNDNGTASSPQSGDLFKAFAINRALTPAEVLQLTNFWGTT